MLLLFCFFSFRANFIFAYNKVTRNIENTSPSYHQNRDCRIFVYHAIGNTAKKHKDDNDIIFR
jgi:hypothetical protein